MSKPRVIAFYLPQYHPVPENDEWWGKGFTEWTNVGKAKPLFRGHEQPKLPGELGYYDLRVPEVREQQAQLAREAGIEGFCYWHYWFGNGKQLLERPFYEVLKSGKPDFPFCLAWANETWKGLDHGLKNRRPLIEQQYPGVQDYINHFYKVLPAFQDERYIKVDGKPLFMIYRPFESPEISVFIKVWRDLAKKEGLEGIYFVGHNNAFKPNEEILATGVDAINTVRLQEYLFRHRGFFTKVRDKLIKLFTNQSIRHRYSKASKHFIDKLEDSKNNVFPTIITGWDHTPRSGSDGFLFTGYTPETFKDHVDEAMSLLDGKPDEQRIIFVKSWNEWAEGNYLEPDRKWGKAFLEVMKNAISRHSK